jgi:hypothetical protein
MVGGGVRLASKLCKFTFIKASGFGCSFFVLFTHAEEMIQ